ncbi:MAG: NAD-glutamate dehydrogenase [Alphaproteobacteria bacterium]|nr:NAD-glutamate dehydrogenase [Alphaproteobacteria bacterium]
MTSFDTKSTLIAAICAELHAKLPSKDTNLTTFVTQFFKRVPTEFLQKMLLPELISIVQEAWRLFQIRRPNESLVKIKPYKLGRHMIPRLGIFMVNLDQPFLIDSITTFLEKNGFKIEIFVHPVLGVKRTHDGKLSSVVELKELHPLSSLNTENRPKHFDYLGLISNVQWNILEKNDGTIKTQSESIAFLQIKANLKQKQIDHLQLQIHNLINQARNVVFDWPSIRDQLISIRDHMDNLPVGKGLPIPLDRQELKDFLLWLAKGYFVFLGARYFSATFEKPKRTLKDKPSILCLEMKPDSPQLGLFRNESFTNSDNLVPSFCRTCLVADEKTPSLSQWPSLTISKTNERSTVHRASRIDSIEIIDWDQNGKPRGLYQFIGIFTKSAFTGSAFDTPIVSRKVQEVFNQFGFAPQWHDGKTLINIINSIPRDELFYLAEDQIYTMCQNVLNMNDEHSLTLSIRPDIFGRYITVMVFLPKEKYSVALKGRMARILEQQLKGQISSENVLLGELDYARLIFVISFSEPALVSYNQTEIEKAFLEAALSWEDYLERFINNHFDEENSATLLARYQRAFPLAYVETFKPEQAIKDIGYIERISDTHVIDMYLYKEKNNKPLKVKIFHARHSLSLSTLLPILKNLGLQVIGETSYSLERDGFRVWIHDFEVDSKGIENWKMNHANLVQAFRHIWKETVENDTLYQLILKVGLNVRQVTLIRAYLKFLRQVQVPYSLLYLEETMTNYAELTRHFVDLFELRFSLKSSNDRDSEVSHLLKDIHFLLEKVDRLDHDKILRRVLNAIEATVRTNYFQITKEESLREDYLKPYLSFKFDCRDLEDLPHPSPLYEIFVYSPRTEAVHLRGAKVARGGIRWSDRLEDFRTEILGLMKAQTVKNAVIVPLGSKGGFVVKRRDKFPDPAQLKEEVVACYQMMMRGMLDITDNLSNGKIVHPNQVICHDDDDPYLVVAADKGTAEFSDIANAISAEYQFWLDDAFASGGSDGYDHKKMGITARGVWESVKRHFRELKLDSQISPFTVVGVGDMKGDVFGNGMLQSTNIRLLAAFNHQQIFLDPDPDVEVSFKERNRLFEMSHSSWKDYNPSFISKGGGVFERSAKSIRLSPECRKAFGISHAELSPDELIKILLCLPVDLLYFGGIGTFIKSTGETHSDVGDRANNDVRVDAKSVRAKIIGEGANLGMTQRARIEYALKGGHLNTDAIDNSAGVDCSDHEVNLKILFNILGNSISRMERNALLKEMTNDVAHLVLADNYRQTQILTVMEAAKSNDINAYQSLIRNLETENHLDRLLEALPDDETLEQRRARNQGMTRPELSVLLAYSKNALYEKILGSALPDGINNRSWYYEYFPDIVQKRFRGGMNAHPLRREITATILTNEVVNRVGPAFIYGLAQTCGITHIEVVKAFLLACQVLELKSLWEQIDALDSFIIADVQTQILLETNQSLEQVILWFLRHPDIKHTNFTSFNTLLSQGSSYLQGDQHHIFNLRNQGFLHIGIPANTAHTFAMIPFFPGLLDIMFLGKKYPKIENIAQTYFGLRSKIGIDWLMLQAEQFHADSEWQRSARTILIDDLAQIQVKLTTRVILENKNSDLEVWLKKNSDIIHHIRPIIASIKSSGHSDLGMLSYAMRQLERLF